MKVVRVLADAAEEVAAAAEWYESERAGLGEDFLRAIEAALDLIEEGVVPLVPAAGPIARRLSARRLMLRRFPYDIVIRERDSESIVIAFAHHARRPGYWRARLKP